ncbi:MAG: hypothetical protein LLG00_01875 [Planctomycetaceae bacterium]|nr:hypothetical protein [Planctomycetaceae bacterium]
MRKLLLSMLAAALVLGTAARSPAESQTKPVLTVSLAGYDKLMSTLGMFGQLAGNPDATKGAEFMLQMMTQGRGLTGLDKTRPWASITTSDGQQFTTFVFVPVTDLKQLAETAQKNPALAKLIKLNGDVYEIEAKDQTIYARQKGDWAIITDNKDRLSAAPADPLKLVGDLPKNYDVAVRLSVKNVPAAYRGQVLAMLRTLAEMGMAPTPDEGDEDHALRVQATKQSLQNINQFVKDLDEVTFGWNVDASAKTTHLDFELTAQTGTALADQLVSVKPAKTDFADFGLPGAAVTANWAGTFTDADVAQAKEKLAMLRKTAKTKLADQGFSDDELKVANKLVDELLEVCEKTVEAKKKDGAVTVLLDPKAITVLGGGAVVDGLKLDKTLKQLVDELPKVAPKMATWFKLNADSYQGVHFHLISTPMPKEDVKPFIGEKLDIVIGTSDTKVFIAAGRDAAASLKKAIDRSKGTAGKEILPMQISVAVTPIAKFIAAVTDDDQVKTRAAALVVALEQAGDKDHVQITTSPIPHGIRTRLQLESGLVKAICSVGKEIAPKGVVPSGAVPAPVPPKH